MAKTRHDSLWRHQDFMKLWISETVSLFGSQITLLALPLTAALLLQVTPLQMGILSAMSNAAFVLVGLFAGIWVDRTRRRPVLIASNLGRALLVGLVPVLVVFDALRIEILYVIALLVGVLTVFFDLAYYSYLPSLVERKQLLEGNTKLELSGSLARVAGPALTGWLIASMTAPFVIVFDALSFLVSALFLSLIRTDEAMPTVDQRSSVRDAIAEGMRVVFQSPLLRATVLCTACYNLFNGAGSTVYILYASRELGFSSSVIGIMFSVGSVGAITGALWVRALTARFGIGPTMVAGIGLSGTGALLIPLATGAPFVIMLVIALGFFLQFLGLLLYNINTISLRQSIVPNHLLGRANACIRFCVWGTLPFGALSGGVLGEQIGLRLTLIISAVGMISAFLWICFSPLLALQDQTAQLDGSMKVDEPSAANS